MVCFNVWCFFLASSPQKSGQTISRGPASWKNLGGIPGRVIDWFSFVKKCSLQTFTPQKSNIDTKNCQLQRELPWVSMLVFGSVRLVFFLFFSCFFQRWSAGLLEITRFTWNTRFQIQLYSPQNERGTEDIQITSKWGGTWSSAPPFWGF